MDASVSSGSVAARQDIVSDIPNGGAGGVAPDVESISPAALKAIHSALRMVSECPDSWAAAIRGAAKVVTLEDGEGCDALGKLSEYVSARLPDVPIDDIQAAIAEGAKSAVAELDAKAEAEAALAAAREGFSDDALALELVYRHGDELRYVALWGKWLIWDGARWQREETHRVFDLARAMLREIADSVNDDKLIDHLRSAKCRAAVESMARSDRAVALTTDAFDKDIWLLNTPDGTVDLRDGVLRPHNSADHITKVTTASPGGACPQWLAFLDTVTGGDQQLVAFLQRMCGYCLTGSTEEHALFFLHGTGQNGKSVFINVVNYVMGDYATTTSMETLNDSEGTRHPTEIARLQGARMATVSETEEGRHWAEARIKKLTGGDPISARFMRQDEFTFVPAFKLVIAGNHKPSLRTVDKAIRRRMNMVPFAITIPEEERDVGLTEKLKSEAPGILRWMIDGCAAYLNGGLSQPAAVTDATEEYLEAEDSVTAWLDEHWIIGAGGEASSGDLYASWVKWAESTGDKKWSQKGLIQRLQTVPGITQVRRKDFRGFEGIKRNSLAS